MSPKYDPLGSFWQNFEKRLNQCKLTAKFEKLRFFLFVQLRLKKRFSGSGHSCFCGFLFRINRIYSNIWPYGHTVHTLSKISFQVKLLNAEVTYLLSKDRIVILIKTQDRIENRQILWGNYIGIGIGRFIENSNRS